MKLCAEFKGASGVKEKSVLVRFFNAIKIRLRIFLKQ